MLKLILMITSAFFQFIYSKRGIAGHIKINKVLRSLAGWHKQDYIHVLRNRIFSILL
jgi:hypothetical protein